MSKLNRKEFKELLIEWKQNFLTEKGEYLNYNKDKEKQTGYLTTIPNEQIGNIENYIKDYIKNNNMSDLMDIVNEDFIEGGIVLPKSSKVLKMFKNYFVEYNNMNKAKVMEDILKVNDDECVIVHASSGDLFKDLSSQSEDEIYHWSLHDIEHKLFSSVPLSLDFYFCNSVLNKPKFKEIFEKNNIRGNEISIPKLLKSGTMSAHYLKGNESDLIGKFFKAINFTENAGFGDQHASVMAFCYSKMPDVNKDELKNIKIDEIENLDSSFSEDEKTWLTNFFKSEVYNITQNAFKELKRVFKNCVLLVY